MLRTPFYDYHVQHGARFVDFAGWEMPILYRSIIEEHRQVRSVGGMFDVSHMGRLELRGRHARRLLERTLTRRISDMQEGQCRYSLICNESGGVLDDVLVYRAEERWLMVVNASNRKKILNHLRQHAAELTLEIRDLTLATAMVALQGPQVMAAVGEVSAETAALKRFRFRELDVLVTKLIVSRTGYTGEDGIEVILPHDAVEPMLDLLNKHNARAEAGEVPPAMPAGLGARDTLRLEAGMPLYGHELDEQTDPLSAGLGFAVSLEKDAQPNGEPFIGQEALKQIAAAGPSRLLVGLKLDGRRSPRQGMKVLRDGVEAGQITSACHSPTLGHPIAMAYLQADAAAPETAVEVDLGRARAHATVVTLPFYKAPMPSAPQKAV